MLRKTLVGGVNRILGRAGIELRRVSTVSNTPPPEFMADEPNGIPSISPFAMEFMADEPNWIRSIVKKVSPAFTMTGPERVIALCHAVEYVSRSGIKGDIVECGVWRGGSMMAAALTLSYLGDIKRSLYLFDTFEGMTSPGDKDRHTGSNRLASDILVNESKSSEVWAISPIEEVQTNLHQTGYPNERLHFIKGRVEDTIPANGPDEISVLRLDTDWYESTRHELVHLFPRLSEHGVIIIDDYGWWEGARKAVDEYLEANKMSLLLHRIDNNGGRIAIKITR